MGVRVELRRERGIGPQKPQFGNNCGLGFRLQEYISSYMSMLKNSDGEQK